MTIKVEIYVDDNVPYEDVQKAFETQMLAIGFVRAGRMTNTAEPQRVLSDEEADTQQRIMEKEAKYQPIDQDEIQKVVIPVNATERAVTTFTADPNGKFPEPQLTDMDGDRKRGEAGPGHRRRTNAQIRDDETYFAQKERAHAALVAMDKGVHDDGSQGRYVITGQSGVEAVTLGDDPQDAADEAAETAARPAGTTLEDLRAAVGRYADKFGPKASIENIRGIIGCAISDVKPDDIPSAIAKVELAISGMTVISPGTNGSAAGPETTLFADEPPAAATKADFVEAFKAYARKYDGTDDASNNGQLMPNTKADVAKLFGQTFGAGVDMLTNIPGGQTPEAFGKIVAAIKQATEQNPFKREAKS